MIRLSRTVRFSLNDPADSPDSAASSSMMQMQPNLPPRHNGFSGWPPMRGLGRYYELRITCEGDIDPVTGYFINITQIDQAAHQTALPVLWQALKPGRDRDVPMGELLQRLLASIQPPLGNTVCELALQLTPFYQLCIRSHDLDHTLIRQEYEFAASHRLHVDTLTPEQNRKMFGKCNHASGHGHNYRVVVTIRSAINEDGAIVPLEDIDKIIDTHAIQHLDHKHLNQDVPQFAGLNPSVENIAMVIYKMVQEPVARLQLELVDISVWETTKTVCSYSGDTDQSVTTKPTRATTTSA